MSDLNKEERRAALGWAQGWARPEAYRWLKRFDTRIAELESELTASRAEWQRWKATASSEDLQRDYLEVEAERDNAKAEVARRGEGVECHAARPGEVTYECSVHDGRKGCPACRLRMAEAEVARLEGRLGSIGAWTHEFGSALIPRGADSYGNGVRDCKEQVGKLLLRALTPPPEEPSDD